MDRQPSSNRELLIPALIGGLSLVGIAVVLMIGRVLSAPAEIAATPSATPFKYVYLGTEPAITTLVVEESALSPSDEPVTEVPVITSVSSSLPPPFILPSRTFGAPGTNTPNDFPFPVSTRTSTATRAATATTTITPGAANTYDDTDPRLTYSGNWTVQTGLETSGPGAVYNGTLHISNEADGKSVTVQFSGREFYFYYQSAPSYGLVTIYLDNDPLAYTAVTETQGSGVWYHDFETSQTHVVKIAHTNGGSINIDKFVIPAATPTPTRTPKP